MLTPKDLQEIKFDKVMFGGYDMGAVDNFLTDIENDYNQLYKENATLKKSMKVLVAKIEEYRGMDDSMRKALSSAQAMASQIVEKAKAEAAQIEADAKAKSETQLKSYSGRIAAEEMRLEEAKTSVQMFIERMLAQYSQASAELQSVSKSEFYSDEMDEPELPSFEPVEPEIKAESAEDFAPVKDPEPVSETVSAEIPATEYVKPAPVTPSKPELDMSIFDEAVKPAPEAPAAKGFNDEFDLSIFDERKNPVTEAKSASGVIPDTVQLPYIPAVPQTTGRAPVPKPAPRNGYEQGITKNEEFPNSVKRARSGSDDVDSETIVLTPKPRFDFSDLQFGDNYDKKDK